MSEVTEDSVLEACSALVALAHCIEDQRHELVAKHVDLLAARLTSISIADGNSDRLALSDEALNAIEGALRAGNGAFQRSIRSCVRSVLSSPLSGCVDLVYP